jgi:putative transposase
VDEKVIKTSCKTAPNSTKKIDQSPTKKQTINNLLIKFPPISRRLICLAVGVNRSGTYRQSHESKMKSRDQELAELITQIRLDSPWYGHRRLRLSLLQDHNQTIGINRIRRVCNLHSLHPKMRKKHPPKRDHNLPDTKHPNLIKELFDVQYHHQLGNSKPTKTQQTSDQDLKPNQIWASDFTYLNYGTKQNPIWYYLGTVIDIYTKEITGFHLSTTHNSNLVIMTLQQALKRFRPPQICHSDQGSEYRGSGYQNVLTTNNIKCSMSAKSSPWENGFQESFYNNFKLELEFDKLPKNLTIANIYNYIANQIEYYNQHRIHTTIKTTPVKHRANYYKTQQTNQNSHTSQPTNPPQLTTNFTLNQEENLVLHKVGA